MDLPEASVAPAPLDRNSSPLVGPRLAFLLTLPVAYNCIFLLGFQDTSARTLAHSFAGVFFYGAIAAKVLIVRVHRFPGWTLPLAGGLVFSTLIAVWWTSALWFFENVDVGL
jgi:uncharacterized membrane protein HdeD (DUF308 family)